MDYDNERILKELLEGLDERDIVRYFYSITTGTQVAMSDMRRLKIAMAVVHIHLNENFLKLVRSIGRWLQFQDRDTIENLLVIINTSDNLSRLIFIRKMRDLYGATFVCSKLGIPYLYFVFAVNLLGMSIYQKHRENQNEQKRT